MINRQNFLRIKEFLRYLEENTQLSPKSLDRYRFSLRHLLLWADEKGLAEAQIIRPNFPIYISLLRSVRNNAELSFSSQKKIIDISKRFFDWAKSSYPREYKNLKVTWIISLHPLKQCGNFFENIFVTLEEVLALISGDENKQDLAKLRDKAAAAFLFLSGIRAEAFVSLPIGAVNLDQLTVKQWPEMGVKTKNRKRATTFLLNIPELISVVQKWDSIVRSSLPLTSPWYAVISHSWGEQILSDKSPGTNRAHTLQRRLKILFSSANIAYKSPHKFRHGHAVFGLQHSRTMADYKAVSMNLMHESIEITDSIYAPLLSSEVKDRIAGLSTTDSIVVENDLQIYLNKLNQNQLKQALMFVADKLTS